MKQKTKMKIDSKNKYNILFRVLKDKSTITMSGAFLSIKKFRIDRPVHLFVHPVLTFMLLATLSLAVACSSDVTNTITVIFL